MSNRIPVQEDVGVAIKQSLFSRTDEHGTPEETLVDYLCIHETDAHGTKTRWLMIAVTKFDKCLLHKAKQNSNGTFSKGKTWQLEDMRQMEQTGPVSFAITMTSRTYKWRTDNARDLTEFLNNLAKTFKQCTGEMPRLINFSLNQKAAAMSAGPTIPAAQSQPAPSQHSRYSDASTLGAGQYPPVPAMPERDRDRDRGQQKQYQSQQLTAGDHTSQPSLPPLSPYTPLRLTPNSPRGGQLPNMSPRGAPASLRSPRTPQSALPGSAPPPPTASAHLLPPRNAPGMASTQSLSSSHRSNNSIDMAAPRNRRPSHGSDTGRSIASQDGSDYRKPKVVSSRAAEGNAIGLGIPPQPQRRGSGDDRRSPIAQTGPRFPPEGSSYRRPSASERPPSHADEDPYGGMDEDPYGGMAGDEGLAIPPVAPGRSEVLVTPVVKEPAGYDVPSQRPGTSASLRKDDRERSGTPTAAGGDKSADSSSVSRSPAPRSTPKLEVDTLAPPRPRERSTTPDLLASQQRRVSFHPPPLTTAYSRDVLLTSRTGMFGAIGEDDDPDEAGDAIMSNVEEMIEGFDWTAATVGGADRSKDVIEGRLLDELAALESANIHAFLESDDRIDQVLAHIDDALLELDDIDVQLASYRMQLGVVSEDIQYIEGQNRGLQVQTSNQHALLNEIRQLLQITDVPREDLTKLSQISPSSKRGVEELELAAASLYKAIQASREKANEVAATSKHMREYHDAASQFSTRVLQYLDIAFKHQSDSTLADYRKNASREPKLVPHTALGENLMAYEGLVLFIKDMDDERYKKLCLNYITTISGLHQAEMGDLLQSLQKKLSATTVRSDIAFSKATVAPPPKLTSIGGAVARAKTVKRGARDEGTVGKKADQATVKVAEAYSKAMSEIVGQIVTEDDFINAFLHLADQESTFADYMQLDTYFRRQATRHASRNNPSLVQIARSVMDLMFGFVDGSLKQWVMETLKSDMSAVVGMIAVTEQLAEQAEAEGTSLFLTQLFDKQLGRHRQAFDHFIGDQIKTIDGAKNNIRKRRGVFYFVRHFPLFVERIECQLDGADNLKIRKRVNDAYERVVASVLSSLQYVSKIVAAETSSGDDKGQLYFHVVMIENLHVFVEEVSHLDVPALAVYQKRAKGLYEENMKAYLKMMMRRGFSRLMDFMDGVERLLRTTAPNEVAMHPNYSKSNLKKVLKDTNSKDMRKAVEAMARRVDKHFTHDDETPVGGVGAIPAHDPATQALIASVWRELSAELVRETTRAIDTIGKCYDNSLTLDYTLRDLESVCQRARAAR